MNETIAETLLRTVAATVKNLKGLGEEAGRWTGNSGLARMASRLVQKHGHQDRIGIHDV
jgi:hypothetical protein